MLPSADEVRAAALKKYRYDAKEGKLYHRSGLREGQPAGTFRMGYIYIFLFDKQIALGRLIWLIEHGRWPLGNIRYENKDTLDNRIGNLRDNPIPRRWREGDGVLLEQVEAEMRRLGIDPYAEHFGVMPPVSKLLFL